MATAVAAVGSSGRAAGEAFDDTTIDKTLAEAALGRLRAALRSNGMAEDAALDLLAADALLTHACEAAAESGPEALEAFVEAVGPKRLARIIAESE